MHKQTKKRSTRQRPKPKGSQPSPRKEKKKARWKVWEAKTSTGEGTKTKKFIGWKSCEKVGPLSKRKLCSTKLEEVSIAFVRENLVRCCHVSRWLAVWRVASHILALFFVWTACKECLWMCHTSGWEIGWRRGRWISHTGRRSLVFNALHELGSGDFGPTGSGPAYCIQRVSSLKTMEGVTHDLMFHGVRESYNMNKIISQANLCFTVS